MVFSIFMLSSDGERVALGDPVSGFDEHRQHERRPAGAHNAAVVAEHRVGGAVDVDAQHGSFHDRDHAVHPVTDDEPPLEPVAVEDRHIRGGDAGRDSVGLAAGAVDVQVVLLSPVAQPAAVADTGRRLGARRARRRRGRRCARRPRRGRSTRQRRPAAPPGRVPARCAAVARQPVQPAVVEVPAAHLRPIEQSQQEGAVGRAAFDHDGGLRAAPVAAGPSPRRGRGPTP